MSLNEIKAIAFTRKIPKHLLPNTSSAIPLRFIALVRLVHNKEIVNVALSKMLRPSGEIAYIATNANLIEQLGMEKVHELSDLYCEAIFAEYPNLRK